MHLGRLSLLSKALLVSIPLSFGILASGCGGGGSGGGSPPPIQPNQPPPIPVDPPPDGGTSTGRFVLRNGDRTEDGLVVGNIEGAAMAADGTVAAIISVGSGNQPRAIIRSATDGSFDSLYDQRNAPSDVNLLTLERIRMAPTGEITFKSGNGLDSDRLHLIADGQEHTLAGAAPGVEAPAFRVLGTFLPAPGGVVAFAGGGQECVPEQRGETTVDICTVALFIADRSGVVTLEDPEFALDRRQADDPRIVANGAGDVYLSAPGRRQSPTFMRFSNGELEVLLRADGEIEGLGELARVEVIGVNDRREALVSVGLRPADPDSPIRDLFGILSAEGGFAEILADDDVENGKSVQDIRGLGFSETGKALYQVTFEDPATQEELDCLRLADANESIDLACIGAPLPGSDKAVISFSGARINDAGDVLFLTTLGRVSTGTTVVEELRATIRKANGTMVTVVSSLDISRLGNISELTTADFNDAGVALLIVERGRSSDRGLIVGS